ncbi:hypothetical protein F5884DRAFT_793605 [Xylogone sp. PMI_703]|nr:hypothetical protein F5884DRAFT_793605 [Xylogone sp. PMI_703]
MTDTSYTTMDPGPKVEDPARPSDPYSPFLALPREIRNMIYTHALTYPSFNRDYQSMRNVPLPPLTTPTILLLNHQITSEALASLHRAPLVIDAAPPSSMGNNLKWIEITDLISYRTLQAVPRVTLAMDLNFQPARKDRFDNALSWANTVEILLDIWGFKHRLEELVVKVDYVPPSKRAGWTFAQAGHHQCVVGLLSKLAKLSSEVPVTFEGDLEVDPWKRRPVLDLQSLWTSDMGMVRFKTTECLDWLHLF